MKMILIALHLIAILFAMFTIGETYDREVETAMTWQFGILVVSGLLVFLLAVPRPSGMYRYVRTTYESSFLGLYFRRRKVEEQQKLKALEQQQSN
jgi:hypothetical protein